MPAEFRHDAAFVVSLFVECILFGFFVLLFFVSTYCLILKYRNHRREKQPASVSSPCCKIWLNLGVSVAMFVLGLMHVIVNLIRMLEAFVFSPLGVGGYLQASITSPLFTLKNTTYLMQTLLGDAFMIYRVYLVWNASWRKLSFAPIIIGWLATLVTGIGMLHSYAKMPSNLSLYSASLREWLIAVFSLTLFTDVACTVLIAWRIYAIHRQSQRSASYFTGPSLLPTFVMIIESGLVYSLCVALLLGFYVADSGAHKILLDAVTQLIGIVFNLIIIRVAMGVSAESTSGDRTIGPLGLGRLRQRNLCTSTSGGGTLTEMEFGPVSPTKDDDHYGRPSHLSLNMGHRTPQSVSHTRRDVSDGKLGSSNIPVAERPERDRAIASFAASHNDSTTTIRVSPSCDNLVAHAV